MEGNKKVGILTGGGDCPGLNAAIRAITKTSIQTGYEVIGIRGGWKGLIDDESGILDSINTSGIIDRGGTILGTSRMSPFKIENGPQRVFDGFKKLGLEALVVLGGEGTLSVACKLSEMGLPLVGIPKTIDGLNNKVIVNCNRLIVIMFHRSAELAKCPLTWILLK